MRVPLLKLRHLHRIGAAVIGVYALFHIGNHLMGLNGPTAHIDTMDALRQVYRHPAVETLLFAVIGTQLATGVYFAASRRTRDTGVVARLQALSGAYLAFFLIVHVSAVLAGRSVFNLDTNFYFAAAGLHVHPFNWFFIPYYFLSVAALFTHLACAARRRMSRTAPARWAAIVPGAIAFAGVACSSAITALLLGWVHAFEIPPAYLATYGAPR